MKELTLAYAPGRVRDWAWHLTWTWPRVVLALVAGAGFVATIYRFIFGLGAATNLSDEWPWALWISLNVLSGVALSAGAFTIAAAVYLFRQRALKPLLRPAILLGFLGYLQVIMGLIVELGNRLLRWLPWAVGLYLILKVGDLVARGQVGELFTGSPEAGLFWLELALIVLPAVLALQPRLRSSRRGQGWLGALVVAGVILNRFNVSHFGLRAWTAAGYVPSLPELAISLGLMAATVLAFIAIAENLPVFSHRPPADRGA